MSTVLEKLTKKVIKSTGNKNLKVTFENDTLYVDNFVTSECVFEGMRVDTITMESTGKLKDIGLTSKDLALVGLPPILDDTILEELVLKDSFEIEGTLEVPED